VERKRSSSGIGQEEGQHRKCSRRRLLFHDLKHDHHTDSVEGALIALVDNLP
jgi:hypothetical protein